MAPAESNNGLAQLEISRTDLMLLGLLMSRSMHGYEIAEYLAQPEMEAWIRLGRTSIYYALGRLEKRGLVSKHSERRGGKPERTVYSITDDGRRTFVGSLEQALSSPTEPGDDFDIALYYANQIEPPRTLERVEARVGTMEDQAQRLQGIISRAPLGDPSLLLVLEHRLAVLRADIDFMSGYLSMLRGASAQAGAVSGSLQTDVLSDVLRSLEAAGRSGVFWVRTGDGDVGLAFDEGRLYGILAPDEFDDASALQRALTSTRGRYEFEPSEVIEAGVRPVGSLTGALLAGSRDPLDPALIDRMLPDPLTLLDVRTGYERDIIGCDLTPDERAVLTLADGVRTVGELAKALKWSTQRVKRTAYPLWAVGWVVRADRSKRDLVVAVSAYVRRWEEAVRVFAGKRGVMTVFEDVALAAGAARLPDFRDADKNLESRGFQDTYREVASRAREYTELLVRAIATRLGEGFVEDVSKRFVRELSAEQVDILTAVGVLG
ncbi:MAG: helix-turn-helix transcriptional regulator [Coriobacteriales bacterium]|nr:helix-turn-helix transcriptional regulator [Coriobacteriales bacterium]